MRRTLWIAPAALVLTGSGLAVVPSQAATVSISIANMSFVGGARKVPQGTVVRWTFDDAPFMHTTTSNQGFWSSPQQSSGEYSAAFPSAGRFPYHCNVHFQMTSKIIVPLRASAIPGGKRVQWAVSLSAGRNFDVKVKRPGSTTWVTFRSATTKLAKNFTPKKKGKYFFKARTRNLANGKVSGWSPRKRVRIG